MEDIIFLRKPAITTSSSLRPKAHLTRDKTLVLGEKTDTKTQAHLKYSRSTATKQGLTSSHPMSDFHKSSSEPVLNYKPKIIPTEPLITEASKPMSRAKIIPVEPKIIPTEPVVDPPDQGASVVVPLPTAEVSLKKADAVPQSILKNRTTPSVKSAKPLFTEKVKEEIIMPLHVPLDEDFGDVDMRIPNQQPATLHPVFLSARQPPTLHHSPPEQQLSPNFAFGSWLTPAEIQASSSVKVEESSPVFRTPSPSSPISPPSESPPSPVDSPISPPLDSPASPPPVLDTESPASPPQSVYAKSFRSSPIAIPTSRIYQNASPEVSHVHCSLYKTRAVEELDNSQVCRSSRTRTRSREGIDNADDMKDFLNSGFDSDLDSSYEDER
ncbi:unnamed protein product [Lymnaea stagnalis]|uniref:Uncharacterized protein n=1 Tax=Lymnaea stagnalis TaxID=6523 RepID=A0AAV2ILI9_LYMST